MSQPEWTHADLVAFAESRGGACLSPEYEGVGAKLRWRCGRDHEFEGSPRLLMMGGYWCPDCFPHVGDTSGWDYSSVSSVDPLLRRFYFPAGGG
jgi:hypothetical protein